MDIGLVLPVEGPRANRQTIISVATTADRLGFHSLWTTDRILMPAGSPGDYPYSARRRASAFQPGRNWLECVATMGLVSGLTEHIRIGSNVLVLPFRNPIVLAGQIATLDALSQGRIILGIGAGWMPGEFEALDVPKAERGAITDEYIAVLKTLWSANENDSFSGRYVRFDGMSLPARPIRAGGPPIFVGGNSDAALRRAARAGDGWLGIDMDPGQTAGARARLHAECRRAHRPESTVTVSMRCTLTCPPASDGRDGSSRGLVHEATSMLQHYEEAGTDLLILDLVTSGDLSVAVEWLAAEVCVTSSSQ